MAYGHTGAELEYFKAKVFYMLMSEVKISTELPLVDEVFGMISGDFNLKTAAKIIKKYEQTE